MTFHVLLVFLESEIKNHKNIGMFRSHTHTMAEKKLKHVFDRQRFEWNASWALGCQWNAWEKFCHRISKDGSAQRFCLLERGPHAKFELNRASLGGPPKRSRFGFFDPWKMEWIEFEMNDLNLIAEKFKAIVLKHILYHCWPLKPYYMWYFIRVVHLLYIYIYIYFFFFCGQSQI